MTSALDHAMRRRPLCAALAAIFACALPASDAPAREGSPRSPITVTVANCNDSGDGSLREAITNAVSGDTIDLGHLGCSRISLTTGTLPTAVDNLTLIGPGADLLTIDGAYNGGQNILFDLGAGALTIKDMTLANGYKYQENLPARGGCIYSLASVTLDGVVLANCEAHATGDGNVVLGGAVYTSQDLTMIESVVSSGYAGNPDSPDGEGRGGGVYVRGSLIAKYSTIENCSAPNLGSGSLGGGAFVYRSALILNSTLSNNYAWHMGAIIAGRGADEPVEIDNSTITNNRAVAWAGVFANAPMKLQNSTIAFNHARSGTHGGPTGIGLHVEGSTLDMESSILANNTRQYYGTQYDLTMFHGTLVGTNNVIVSANVAVPPGTLQIDPALGPLRDNGGITLTRMPMTGSPVIDAGNNVQGVTVDQRGPGYPRMIGAAPDIGAVEYFDDDDIFWNDFEPR